MPYGRSAPEVAAEVKSHQHPQVEEVFDDESAEHWSGATLNSLFVEVVAPRINPQAHAENAPALEPQVASSAVVEAAQRHDRPPDGTVRQAWPESYASVKIGPPRGVCAQATRQDAKRRSPKAAASSAETTAQTQGRAAARSPLGKEVEEGDIDSEIPNGRLIQD